MILAATSFGTASAQTTIYQTDFESTADPSGTNFTLGNLNGKGSWVVEAGGTANVVNSPLTAPSGSNYVAMGSNTAISRTITNASSRVLMRGFYYGTGSTELQVPDAGTPMAAVLGFRTLSPSTFTIAAYDGVAGDYVEATGTPAFSNTQWHKIVISLNYTTKRYDVSVNNQPLLQNVNFRDSSINQLSGFQSYSETSSNIDRIGFFASNGDFDGDGISDDDEMRMPGADPLDPALPGFLLGDLDGNRSITPVDAQTAFMCWLQNNCTVQQIAAGDIAPDNGDNCIGAGDGDGAITPADAQRILNMFLMIEAPCM
jgi:hypothetical protein